MFKIIIKLIIAALLFACWANKLTEHFQLIKIMVCIGFAWLAYIEFKADKLLTPTLFGIGAIILNPFFEIPFLSGSWDLIYLIFAIGSIILSIGDLFNPQKKQKFLE